MAVEEAWATISHGWTEYIRQPVLPASLAYVLVCFNVALAPGALMTTFLVHNGTCYEFQSLCLHPIASVIIELGAIYTPLAHGSRWQA